MTLGVKHERSFFSVLSPHLRSPRSRLPQVYLSETSILPKKGLKNASHRVRCPIGIGFHGARVRWVEKPVDWLNS